MAITIAQETTAGNEQTLTLPSETRRVEYHTTAATDAVGFRGNTSGGTKRQMVKDQLYVLEGRDLAGQALFWHGTGEVYIQIETGIGS